MTTTAEPTTGAGGASTGTSTAAGTDSHGAGPSSGPGGASPAGGAASSSASRRHTSLGLAMRFSVTLDNTHLGEWQSCSGLSMNFKPEGPKHRGGDHLGQYYLAGELEYPAITLARAMNGRDSPKLQQWLGEVTRKWAQGEVDESRTATIALLDADRRKVASWTLRGVVPLSWTGPDLAAGNNNVAIEKLQLGHQGFLTGQSSHAGQTRNVITLSKVDKPSETVTFPYNTDAISITRSTRRMKTDDRGLVDANITHYDVKNLLLVGPHTQRDVDLLVGFATKERSAQGEAPDTDESGSAEVEGLPDLTFNWGTFTRTVKLQTLTTSYTRFNSDGIPVRASILLKLQHVEQQPAAASASPAEPPQATTPAAAGGDAGAGSDAGSPTASTDAGETGGAGDAGGDAEDRKPSAGRDVRTGRSQRT